MPKKAPPPLLPPTCGNEPLGVTGKSLEKNSFDFCEKTNTKLQIDRSVNRAGQTWGCQSIFVFLGNLWKS